MYVDRWDIQLGLWANGLNNPDRINIGALCRPGSVIIREFIDINTTKGVCSRQMDVLMGHIMHYLSAATKLARDEATLLGPSNYLCHFVFFLFIAIDKNRLLLQNLLDRGLWITNWEHIRLHIRCYRVLILHVSQFTTPFNGVEMLDGLTSEGPHHNFEGLHRGTDRMFRNLENRLGFGPIDDCETSGELSIWPL